MPYWTRSRNVRLYTIISEVFHVHRNSDKVFLRHTLNLNTIEKHSSVTRVWRRESQQQLKFWFPRRKTTRMIRIVLTRDAKGKWSYSIISIDRIFTWHQAKEKTNCSKWFIMVNCCWKKNDQNSARFNAIFLFLSVHKMILILFYLDKMKNICKSLIIEWIEVRILSSLTSLHREWELPFIRQCHRWFSLINFDVFFRRSFQQ